MSFKLILKTVNFVHIVLGIVGRSVGQFEVPEQKRCHWSKVDEDATWWSENGDGGGLHHEKGAA